MLWVALAGPFVGVVAGDEAAAAVGADGGGPLAGTIRPGGPRAGNVCGPLCGAALDTGTRGVACASVRDSAPPVLSVAFPPAPSPSTKAKRPSLLSLSRSRAAPFRASCFQKSYSLIQETKTTLCPSSPPSCVLSSLQRKRMSSQFALAPRVLVSRRIESRGSWT